MYYILYGTHIGPKPQNHYDCYGYQDNWMKDQVLWGTSFLVTLWIGAYLHSSLYNYNGGIIPGVKEIFREI